ncbi:5'-3' exoribonuclease [Echinococcus granulosus]|uniref:5'-3' exoribonuclease n=1 Tax=Echinococcus granulosus TaxID=6210 RepID=W6V9J7_ECHGR|nr:5'-3' exoribonuclease [Echinococcus granulosus]EUB63314.1 5'-3' exoribonuclease [Echinococcus granulosus]
MTQQRARRFVGAEKLATELKKRREKEPEFDEKSLFDPNVISPGTEFMESLHEFFKRFIANQISSDPLWRRIDVIYSGHDVPGEGEQKIREYMLYQRTLSGYQPNERHCLYGMDADLIFLGLATHEPNLCILRENVYTVKSPLPQDIPFCLVHLSLLREYIGLEFKNLEVSNKLLAGITFFIKQAISLGRFGVNLLRLKCEFLSY